MPETLGVDTDSTNFVLVESRPGSAMQALVYLGPGKRALQNKPRPTIQEPSDAVVRVVATTICGTDLHILKGDVPTCWAYQA